MTEKDETWIYGNPPSAILIKFCISGDVYCEDIRTIELLLKRFMFRTKTPGFILHRKVTGVGNKTFLMSCLM